MTNVKTSPKPASLPPVTESLPTVAVPTVEVITDLSVMDKTPSLRIVSDAVKAKNADKLSGLVSKALVTGKGYTDSVEAAAKELRAFRLMFPAAPETQKVLGENAPDLAGQTPAYRAAWGKVLSEAADLAVESLVAEGVSQKAAELAVQAERETFRKSVSRRYRLNVEAEARKLGPLGARFLLAHGFERNGECGPKQILTKGAKLILPEVPEGETLNIADVIVQLPTIAPATTPPVESSDQTPPTQTADAVEGERMGDEVLNPFALINEAVGMLNRSASLLKAEGATSTKRERDAARKALLAAVQSVADALGA